MREQIQAYLAQRAAEGLATGSIDEYRTRLDDLRQFLGTRRKRRVADVTIGDIDGYLKDMKDRGLSHSVRKARASTAGAFFRWLAEQGKLLSNPARDVRVRRDPDDEQLKEPPLEEADVHDLLENLPRRNAIDLRNRAHLELLYACGLRLSESLAMDVGDIDLAGRMVRVRKGKGAKQRDVPMMRGAYHALRDYLALRRTLLKSPDHGALLLARRGQRLKESGFRAWLRVLNQSRRGKRRVRPHLLRHSIAVHLLRGGMDIRHLAEFLGHEDLDYTKTYLRLVPSDLRADYDSAMPIMPVDGE